MFDAESCDDGDSGADDADDGDDIDGADGIGDNGSVWRLLSICCNRRKV